MTTPVQGQQFDPDEQKMLDEMAKHWRKMWNKAPVQALTRVEDAAQQMIVVTTGLQGLSIAVFAFSDIRAWVMAVPGVLGMSILLLLFMIEACWLVSLFYATRVFFPRVQPGIDLNKLSADAWQKIRDRYGRVNEEKLHKLHRSHLWLTISFVLVLIAVAVFVALPVAPTEPTQIIIVTPTPVARPTSIP